MERNLRINSVLAVKLGNDIKEYRFFLTVFAQ